MKEQGTEMGQLYDLIQRHVDDQPYDVSQRQLASRLGVSPSSIKNWREPTKLIAKEHLVAIARVTRVPYQRVLQALLEDIGYWYEESDGNVRRDAAPTNVRKLKTPAHELQTHAARDPKDRPR